MSDMQGGTGSRSHRLLQRCMLPEAGRTRRSPGHTAGAGDAVPASSNRLVFEGVPRLGQPRPHSGAAEVVGMRNEIELQEAYVRLKALRNDLPDAVVLEQHWVTDFHALVEMLADLAGADLRGFVVPDSAIVLCSPLLYETRFVPAKMNVVLAVFERSNA